MPNKPYMPEIDYVNELKENELKREGDKTFVYLKGLERLAKERGIASAVAMRLEPILLPSHQGIMCTYQYQFVDGQLYQGSADATAANCNPGFGNFLTAMAESRAKARALRTAFGITLCSVEEKADGVVVEEVANAPIEDHQVKAATFIAKQKGLTKVDFLGLLSTNFGQKDIKLLTKQQANELISKLNAVKR
jgi:hypothetical protein